MSKSRAELLAAAEALEWAAQNGMQPYKCGERAAALRAEADGMPDAAPVAWASENVIPLRGIRDNFPCILTPFKCDANTVPLYTAPPPDERMAEQSDDEPSAADFVALGRKMGNLDMAERVRKLERLLRRYRNETLLGHQPHMIAHEVDAALAKGE